jgi:hypothetical protein
LFKPLPAAELAIVNEALGPTGNLMALIVSAPGCYVNRHEFRTIRPGELLLESVIDFYMHCLRQRQNQVNEIKTGQRFFYYFRTAISHFLNPNQPYDYHQIRRWTQRNVPHNDLFKCDAVFFPWNVNHTHWILIVAFLKERTLQVFCSLGNRHKAITRIVWRYLKDEYKDKHLGKELPDQESWTFHYRTANSPQQRNGFDCGVFVCMTADFLSNGWPLIYTQAHVEHCRLRIAHGCLNNCAVTTKAVTLLRDEIWSMRYRLIVAVLLQRDRFLELLAPGNSDGESDGTMCTITPDKPAASKNTASHSFQPKDGERFYLFHHFLKEQRELNPFTAALKAKKKLRDEQAMIKANVYRMHREKAAAEKLHGIKSVQESSKATNSLMNDLKAVMKTNPSEVATLRETQLII